MRNPIQTAALLNLPILTASLLAAPTSAVTFWAVASGPTVSDSGVVTGGGGEEFTVELFLDASDLDNATDTTYGFSISLFVGSGGLPVTGGSQAPAVFQVDDGSGPTGGIPLASVSPPNNDVNGNVVSMATYISGLHPAGAPLVDYASTAGGVFIASVTMAATYPGLIDIRPYFSADDGFELNGADISDSVRLLTVPEPGTATLLALGLVCLATRRRRTAPTSRFA